MNVKSNRWGPQDEAGAYNLIDCKATIRGLSTVREGRAISLAMPIKGGARGPVVPTRPPAHHYMIRDGGDYCAGLEEQAGFGFADDVIMLPTHGATHIDALAHVWRNGLMYNGFEASTVNSRGASRCGIDKLGPIVTRALFADFSTGTGECADSAIRCDALQTAIARGGITPEPGDALLVRTGWMAAYKMGKADPFHSAGLHYDCADWIIDQGFALVAADNVAVEALPSADSTCAAPLHIRLIRDSGIYLAELLDLDELATARRSACALIVSPLRIVGGVGSPVNPVAIL